MTLRPEGGPGGAAARGDVGGRRDFRSRVSGLFSACANFLLPPACAGCGGPVPERAVAGAGSVCQNCRLSLPPVPHPLCPRCGAPLGTGEAPSCLECQDWPAEPAKARTLCLLQSPARELVHALKYQGWRSVGDFMGTEMARNAPEQVRRAQLVVPVPTSARNMRRRGYNQAEVIASALALALDLPLLTCLERRGRKGTQTSLNPTERRANVSDAFVLAESVRSVVTDRRIVLVDDVITTGATVLAAVEALALAAPGRIVAYAFARTVPMSQDVN